MDLREKFSGPLDKVTDSKLSSIAIGLVLGIALLFGFQSLDIGNQDPTEELIPFLENQTGQDLEVITTEEAGEFYEVQVRDSQDNLLTYYVSKDGKTFTQNMQNIDSIRQRGEALIDFRNCLSNSGTIMFGNGTQRATQLQVQRLGGANIVAPIYRDVNNETILSTAAQLGVQQVPAFYRNQTAIQGVQTLQTVEQFTGCSYEAEN